MSEGQLQQLMQELRMLEAYFSDLSGRDGPSMTVLENSTDAIESLKSLNQKSDCEALVPIGMGVNIQAKLSSDSKIILDIGAGTAVEKDFDSTINYLEARIKEAEISLRDNALKKQDAIKRLEGCRDQINQLMQAGSPFPPKSG